MNGYIIYDHNTGGMGLVEMSHKNFAYFKSNSLGGYDITTKPDNLPKEYDREMVQPGLMLGMNYPALYAIRDELKSKETRPARRPQFLSRKGSVIDIETMKELITYTDPKEPLSIYGRWDLGFGTTPTPKKIPDGSADATAGSASMMEAMHDLNGELDLRSPKPTFWMKYGSATFNGKPFIWSKSEWKGQKLRWVPDKVYGEFILINTYIK
jgi:hypothetical protein